MNKNKHRNKRGQYASLALKAERMAGIAAILLVLLWHVHDANKPHEDHLTALKRQVIELEQVQDELQHQAIMLENHPDLSKYEAEIEAQKLAALPTHTGFATAYSCEGLKTHAEIMMNCPSKLNPKYPNGRTATGTVPDPERTIACDPENTGRTFYIEGVGKRKCEDTGGAIKGAGRFDVYLPHVNTARTYGGQVVEYKVLD